MTTARILAIMGSGETAPTMKGPHRAIFERLDADTDGRVDAVLLDTPFGFQENAPILAAKATEYFRDAIGREVVVAGLGRTDTGDVVAIERGVSRVRNADWVFAGPGSPTFALEQWRDTPVPDALAEKLRSGGAVVFSSAAVLTLGVATVPVYEIYKVGLDPYWVPGLDVLSEIGLNVAVIPHYDNQEGGNHDTRFCYLGERRLAMLEPELPDGAFVLGIDEHTGVIIDLETDTAEIVGKGAVTLRRNGQSVRIESGATVPVDLLRAGPTASSILRRRHTGVRPRSEPSLRRRHTGVRPRSDPWPKWSRQTSRSNDAPSRHHRLPRRRDRRPRVGVLRRPRCTRRRYRGRRDPRTRISDRRLVARHAAVRRRRPGASCPPLDDRAPRSRRDRGRSRRPRGARSRGRGGARRPRAWPAPRRHSPCPTPSVTNSPRQGSRCETLPTVSSG